MRKRTLDYRDAYQSCLILILAVREAKKKEDKVEEDKEIENEGK